MYLIVIIFIYTTSQQRDIIVMVHSQLYTNIPFLRVFLFCLDLPLRAYQTLTIIFTTQKKNTSEEK